MKSLSITLITVLFLNIPSLSQDSEMTLKSRVKDFTESKGYFTFYRDLKNDKIYLLVNDLNSEFLYINSLQAGIGSNDIGLDRGQLGGERVVKFQRYGNKLMLIQPNYNYRADSNNPDETKAVDQAFAKSILWGFVIDTEEKGSILIDISDFILRDAHDVIGTLKRTDQGNYNLEQSRSAIYDSNTKNFPENTEFEALLTFTGKPEGNYIRSVTPTPEAITVRQHHSFVKLPDSNYIKREFNPNAGVYAMSYLDYATPISENIRKHYIYRHRLEKKDPNATLSEAVEPIIYYLDRGTPEPIRSALLEGAGWWNQAFEAIGYKDAFQIKMLPEGVDPMDVRYNVIQWVHRSTRGWSYGSWVGDPRTGEIIKGHVSLGSLRVRQDFLIAEGLLAPYENGDETPSEMEKMALARLRQLSAHEVGHTLGFTHNFAASTNNRASVMDYPHPLIKIVNGKINLNEAYDNKIGEWDKAAVAYAYQVFAENFDERAELGKIINQSNSMGLKFISDRDARPTGGANPDAHLWDNGTNPSQELDHILHVRKIALENFSEKNIRNGEPMSSLEEVLAPVYFLHRYQLEGTVKLLGGLNYSYNSRGDGLDNPQIVSPKNQEEALQSLLKSIDPHQLSISEDILKLIPPKPMGYNRGRENFNSRTGLTFDPLGAAETASNMTVSLILNPQRASRLIQYHSRDNQYPSLTFVVSQLIDKTWKSTKLTGTLGQIQTVTDNVVLQNLINLSRNDLATTQARAVAYHEIDKLKLWLESERRRMTDSNLKAHFSFAIARINEFQKNPTKGDILDPLTAPAGSPIGMQNYGCSQSDLINR